MAFYASCPCCKLPNLVENTRDSAILCASCGKSFGVFEHTVTTTWTLPPTRSQPPPLDQFESQDARVEAALPRTSLPGGHAGRSAQGFLMMVVVFELIHAMAGCLVLLAYVLSPRELPHVEVDHGVYFFCVCPLGSVLTILAAVSFLIWFGQSYNNLAAHSFGEPRHHSALAVASFLIPGLNLFLPYQVMQDLWKMSDPMEEGVEPRGNLRLIWWWVCWVSGLVSYGLVVGGQLLFFEHPWDITPSGQKAVLIASFLGPLFLIIAGLLLMGVIDEIIQRQTNKFLKQWDRAQTLP